MRVAVVAGPDAGHAIPAIALCRRFVDAGDDPTLFTGKPWLDGLDGEPFAVQLLPGLAPRVEDDDMDAGKRLHERSAYMGNLLAPALRSQGFDFVVSDVLTAAGGLAAELCGLPWVELSPHPLYLPSKGLPPIGSGLAPGTGLRGRLRDAVMRMFTARSVRGGDRQRSAARVGIGLPAGDPGPLARLIATIPALEVPRPDWPDNAHLVGPLLWEPTDEVLELPSGGDPVVMVAPSTAFTGADGMVPTVLRALDGAGVRVVVSMLDEPPTELPDWATAGLGRQDVLLRDASVVVCGGGHGMLAKALLAGRPVVTVPGGGDQWELANRAQRQGSALLVRPLSVEAVREAVQRVRDESGFRAAAESAAAGAAEVADPVQICRDVLAASSAR